MTNAERQSKMKSYQKDLNRINKRITEAENNRDTADNDSDFYFWAYRTDELIQQRSDILYKMRKVG